MAEIPTGMFEPASVEEQTQVVQPEPTDEIEPIQPTRMSRSQQEETRNDARGDSALAAAMRQRKADNNHNRWLRHQNSHHFPLRWLARTNLAWYIFAPTHHHP